VRELIEDPQTVLIDARSNEEFIGERFWPSGAESVGRAGHIPGAVHAPVDLAGREDGSLADGEDLRRACERLGVEPGRRVVLYCTIGNRASQVAFALKHLLGYPDVAVYYGSWSEWGSLPHTPVET
jgi:thiosulfate/3-mercaptopyruvate sulfurtransferase